MASQMPEEIEEPVRVWIPADLDAGDELIAGLTPGQVLSLGVMAAPTLLICRVLAGRVPFPVLLVMAGPPLAAAVLLVLGRRDGVRLDRWLASAFGYRARARTLRTAVDLTPPPANDGPAGGRQPRQPRQPRQSQRSAPAPLLGITQDGVLLHADGRHVAVVACTTITRTLATHQDDAILAAGMARWLNSLSGPVQIVVQNRPSDLATMATALAARANRQPNPEMAALALDRAEFLLSVYESVRPLQRSVLIACSGGVSTGTEQLLHNLRRARDRIAARHSRRTRKSQHDGHEPFEDAHFSGSGGDAFVSRRAAAEALSRARRVAAELEALGAETQILDGPQVRHVLAGTWTPCQLRPAFHDESFTAPVSGAEQDGPRGSGFFGDEFGAESKDGAGGDAGDDPGVGPGVGPADTPGNGPGEDLPPRQRLFNPIRPSGPDSVGRGE